MDIKVPKDLAGKKCKVCRRPDFEMIGYLNMQTNKRLVQCRHCRRVVMLKGEIEAEFI